MQSTLKLISMTMCSFLFEKKKERINSLLHKPFKQRTFDWPIFYIPVHSTISISVYVITICSTVCRNWHLVINQSIFYDTIHIFSKQQLRKWIQLTKERRVNNKDNKPIGYYVKSIIFRHGFKLQKEDMKYLLVFSNLQYIYGLKDDFESTYSNKSIYLQLQRPVDFFYCPQDEQWTIKFNKVKTNLKSLSVFISDKLAGFNSHEQQLETIYMKPKEYYQSNKDIPIKMLILPAVSLKYLIKLNIDFTCTYNFYGNDSLNYTIDQHTFENIHQSCPLLESLSIKQFYMNISNGYDNNNNNNNNNDNNIIPAQYLKIFIIECKFYSPQCFAYLSIKYPNLESLSLNECAFYQSEEKKGLYQHAILKMLLKFTTLNTLIYRVCARSLCWPHYSFFKWLNLPSTRLKQLEYRWPLTEIGTLEKYIDTEDMDNSIDIKDKLILSLQQPFNYLNHLANLTIDLENLNDLAFTFLLENKNISIISTILEELTITDPYNGENQYVYIYDWLDLFPNLSSLGVIGDDMYLIDNSKQTNNFVYFNADDCYSKVHPLVNKRNKRQKHQVYDPSIKLNDNKQSIYKLKSLKIIGTPTIYIWFTNGFDELLKKCDQLNTWELSDVIFIGYKDPSNKIHLDLTHLHFKFLSIHTISYLTTIEFGVIKNITKYVIQETLTDRECVMENNKPIKGHQQFVLNIKCKFIDEIAYNVH
ncbi:unnamed protein product [Cunninghamella blakesleeana]